MSPKLRQHGHSTRTDHCLISEYANGQSGDQWPHPKEVGLTVPQDAAARPYKGGEDVLPGAIRMSRMQ